MRRIAVQVFAQASCTRVCSWTMKLPIKLVCKSISAKAHWKCAFKLSEANEFEISNKSFSVSGSNMRALLNGIIFIKCQIHETFSRLISLIGWINGFEWGQQFIDTVMRHREPLVYANGHNTICPVKKYFFSSYSCRFIIRTITKYHQKKLNTGPMFAFSYAASKNLYGKLQYRCNRE